MNLLEIPEIYTKGEVAEKVTLSNWQTLKVGKCLRCNHQRGLNKMWRSYNNNIYNGDLVKKSLRDKILEPIILIINSDDSSTDADDDNDDDCFESIIIIHYFYFLLLKK